MTMNNLPPNIPAISLGAPGLAPAAWATGSAFR